VKWDRSNFSLVSSFEWGLLLAGLERRLVLDSVLGPALSAMLKSRSSEVVRKYTR
jgi:hypothetical protein